MSAELKPCPFCGEYDGEVAATSTPTIDGGKKVAVYCNGCFCEGPLCDTEADAIEAWNRRAALSRPKEAAPSEEWQPISTAPKDGTYIMVAAPGKPTWCNARWQPMTRVPDRWQTFIGPVPFEVTHWRPIPQLAATQAPQEGDKP